MTNPLAHNCPLKGRSMMETFKTNTDLENPQTVRPNSWLLYRNNLVQMQYALFHRCRRIVLKHFKLPAHYPSKLK